MRNWEENAQRLIIVGATRLQLLSPCARVVQVQGDKGISW